MKPNSRLTLESADKGAINATLEYTFSTGESITLRLQVPRRGNGRPSMTVQQIEESMLQRAIELAQNMLDARSSRGA